MARRRTHDLAVGTLFALALIILALGIMAVGGESKIFVSKTRYVVTFPNADGLREGSPVRMAGVQVGSVSSIRLPTDPSDAGIEVGLSVDRAYSQRVRSDSGAKLRILLYLSGEKFVEIIPGTEGHSELPDGARIPLIEQREILERGEDIAENLYEITVSLSNILAPLERGEGLIGQMLRDPEFGKGGLEALRGSLVNIEHLTRDLLELRGDDFEGQGMVGRLLYDRELAGRLDSLGDAVANFASLMETVSREEGVLGEMLRDDSSAHQAIRDFAATAASLKAQAQGLEAERGLLGRLINDEEYSDALAEDLRRTLSNAAEITDKINRGEGTLGALVNDRTVYEGAEEVIAGVNSSKFARWVMRHYQKKGIEAGDDPHRDPAPDDF